MNNKVSIDKKEKTTKITYGEVYQKWFSLYRLSVKDSTAISVNSIFINHILPEVASYNIEDIGIDMVQDLIIKWYSMVKSYKNLKIQLSRVFDYAVRLEIIDKNPCKLIIMPKAKEYKIKKVKFWTKEELKLFLDKMELEGELKWYAFFRLLAFSGIRKGEALALKWQDIDFRSREVYINKTLTKTFTDNKYIDLPKTRSSIRHVDIDKKTIDVLKQFWHVKLNNKKKQKSDIIFVNGNLNYFHPTQPLKVLNRMVKKYDLKPMTVHGFRHTHCSLLFESGASIKEVQDRLGHSDIHTTMNIYAHVSKTKKIEVAKKLATYLAY